MLLKDRLLYDLGIGMTDSLCHMMGSCNAALVRQTPWLFYFADMQQAEVAPLLKLSQASVSQIETLAEGKMRAVL